MNKLFTKIATLSIGLAMAVGVGVAVGTNNNVEVGATPTTYQHVFNAKPSTGNNISLSSVNWTVTATNLGNYNGSNYAGVQVGTSSKKADFEIETSSNWGAQSGSYLNKTKVTEIRLWLNAGNTTTLSTLTASVGGVSCTPDKTQVTKNSSAAADWKKATKITFTVGSTSSGKVDIHVAHNSSLAVYICCLEIDCEEPTVINSYSVEYNSNGGGTAPTDENEYTASTIESVNLAGAGSMSKTGHTCDGWALSSNGEKQFEFSQTGVNLKSYANNSGVITLYAHWVANSYTVTYQKGDYGLGNDFVGEATPYNTSYTLLGLSDTGIGPNNDPDNDIYYKFAGWKIGNNTYAAGSSYTITAENVNAVAQWLLADKVTVTYSAGDGDNAPEAVEVAEGGSIILPSGSNMTAPSGKYFSCWIDEDDYVYNSGDSVEINSNTTFTAHWATHASNDTLIVEPEYLNLSSTYTSEFFEEATDGVYYDCVPAGTGSDPVVKAYTKSSDNKFDDSKDLVFMGKGVGTSFYNYTPLGKRIKSIEIVSPTGAAGGYYVACEFSSNKPITDSISTSTNTTEMSAGMDQTLMNNSSIIDGDYHFFRIEITEGNKNCQFQLRITLIDEAYVFAQQVLKQTKGICNSSYDGHSSNKAALTSVWTTLSGASYYGKLKGASLDAVVGAAADSTITVPSTDSEIESMSNANVLKAAMYRYDYCTAKYELDAFVQGRTLTVSFEANSTLFNLTSRDSNTTTIVIIISLTIVVAFGGYFFIRRRKHQ